jgi:SH3 domain-containing protein
VNGIIRGRVLALAAALGLLASAGCLSPASSGGGTPASSSRSPSAAATASPAGQQPSAVWVLNPVGVNVRSGPDTSADRVTTLTQGARLDVVGQQVANGQTWLHVQSTSGQVQGWVLDRADLLIHVEVAQHIEPAGWSILFPKAWDLQTGNPTTFTGPPSDPEGGALLVQTSNSTDHLLSTPRTAGGEVRQESPLEVYGKTTYLTVYKLDAGGWEFAVRLQYDANRAFLFDYRQSQRPDADTSLFKQLLTSVIVQG